MKNNLKHILGLLLFLALLSSCRSHYMMPDAAKAHENVYGSFIEIKMTRDAIVPTARGELIAVDDTVLYLLSEEEDEIYHLHLKREWITNFRLHHYRGKHPVAFNIFLGLVPISHGVIAPLSLVTNIVTMGIVNGRIKDRASSRMDEIGFEDLSRYARFPQGFPPGLEFSDLEPIPKGYFRD